MAMRGLVTLLGKKRTIHGRMRAVGGVSGLSHDLFSYDPLVVGIVIVNGFYCLEDRIVTFSNE